MHAISIAEIAVPHSSRHDRRMTTRETEEERQARTAPIIARIKQAMAERKVQQATLARAERDAEPVVLGEQAPQGLMVDRHARLRSRSTARSITGPGAFHCWNFVASRAASTNRARSRRHERRAPSTAVRRMPRSSAHAMAVPHAS